MRCFKRRLRTQGQPEHKSRAEPLSLCWAAPPMMAAQLRSKGLQGLFGSLQRLFNVGLGVRA